MNRQYDYNRPPYPQPPCPPYGAGGWYTPAWADPQRLEQKEMRRAASRLSFAVLASLPIQMLLSIVASLLLSVCGVDVYGFDPDSIGGFPATAYYLISSIGSFVSIVLPFSFFLFLGKRRLSDTILVEKTGALNGVLLVFAGLFVCMIMNIPANWISQLLEGAGLNGAVNTESFTVGSVTDLITMFLAIVLVAPVTEEFAFRGVTAAVMRRWGDWPAVLFSMLIFAMAHYSFQSLPVVLMGGFVMALLYVRTRNIWINIFVHFLNNLIATLPIAVEFLFGSEAAQLADSIAFFMVIGLGISALTILLVRHFTGHPVFRGPMQPGIPVRNKAMQLVVNPGFITYFVCFIAMAVISLYAV
ncbi:MAG: lysostaphin resistance A-like protein [Hominenteromicrobium sp.]